MVDRTAVENANAHLTGGDTKPLFDMLASDVQRVEAENTPYSPGGLPVGHDAVQTDVFDKLRKDFTDFDANIVRVVAAAPLPVDEPPGPTVPGARRRKDQTDPCPR